MQGGVYVEFDFIQLDRTGSNLLFRVLRRSTIGDEEFHSRVREGIACIIRSVTTGSMKLYKVLLKETT